MNRRTLFFALLTVLALCARCARKETEIGIPVATHASVTSVVGIVSYVPHGKDEWRELKAGKKLRNHDIIRTEVESKISMHVEGIGDLVVGENSLVSLELDTMPDGTLHGAMNARYGTLLANLGKLVGRGRFTVRTPTATAAIRGTSFRTEVDRETGESAVQVLRGKVAVNNREFRKTENDRLVADDEAARTALSDIDENDPSAVANTMAILSNDWELKVEKLAQQKIIYETRRIREQARAQGLSQEETDSRLAEAHRAVADEIQPLLASAQETAVEVEKGKAVEITEQTVSEPEDITFEQVEIMKNEFSEEAVEEALAPPPDESTEDTTMMHQAAANTAPRIVSTPDTLAYANTAYAYEVRAEDDERDELRFSLAEAPGGMDIAVFTGAISWVPTHPGQMRVVVQVKDSRGQAADQEFAITVRPGLRGSLDVRPAIGGRKTRFVFDGSKSADESSDRPLAFRWDFTGDGTWDFPQTGFTNNNVTRHTYIDNGVFTARMEIVNARGVSQVLTKKVVVDDPPLAVLNIAPVKAEPGATLSFDAAASSDNGKLKYRFDFNGDGTWDEPKSGYTRSPVISQTVNASVTATALVEVIDAVGQKATARASYSVGYGCEVAITGTEQDRKVNLVTRAAFNAEARDRDGRIVEYAWDFDGDGTFDYSSKETAQTSHHYGAAGTYTAIFRAISDDGSTASDTVTVNVYNAKPSVDAGKDRKLRVGEKVTFDGTASDADSEIRKYEWDFDGDGEYDYSSTRTGRVDYAYQKVGTFTARLRVSTNDGQVAEDAINVTVGK